jgi:alpha-tubulin suppressor-like RCC1 family protein
MQPGTKISNFRYYNILQVLQSLFDTGMISTKLPNGIAFIPRLKGEIVMQVATGSNHFLCRTSSGRIWAFGCSEKGQMGMQVHPVYLLY